ncbi:MAG TPA: CoA-binding protein [Thermoanaerobaculia bacterium]|jgi:predicted CoA-binding protein|nr:CoA-binding protein [Thermoanaerobaculia bacterium]
MPTIAVLGASSNRQKFGNKCVRAYAHAGYQVFPINPTEKEIEGFPVFAKLADVPQALDRISVYLPPPVTFDYLDEIEAAKAGEVWLNPGAYDAKVLEEARRRGIPIRPGCSIVDIELSPAMFGA